MADKFIYLVVVSLLAVSASAASSPAPKKSPLELAIAAIQGTTDRSRNCPLQVSANAKYDPKTASVSGSVTYTNPTSQTTKVRSEPRRRPGACRSGVA